MSTPITEMKAYQIDDLIAGSSGALTTSSTLAQAKTFIQTGIDKPCPQCRTVGVVDSGANECPTCEGNQYTAVQKKIDLDNSTLVYIDA